jgi:hypothetical protein
MNNNITINLEDAKLIMLLADRAPESDVKGVYVAIERIRSQIHEKKRPLGAQLEERVLIWARRFSEPNEPKPIVRDGVTYYQVGRNSSHSFYAGVDIATGKLYRASDDTEFGGEWYSSEKESFESFRNDYMGHY